jgi:hypothetical protein
MENVPLRDLLWRVCFRRKLRPGQVTGDTTYGTVENIVAVEEAGIRAFFPLPDFEARTPFFGKGAFIYDPARDAYRCPQGQLLPRRQTKYTEHEVLYRADARTCNACLVKTECTASEHGRIVHRSFYAEYLDKVRRYHTTETYQKAMRKRKVWVEPLFAGAKESHGLRRLRLRGVLNANIQGLLVAAGQNLRRLLANRGWGRRHAPGGSLLPRPKEPWRLMAAFGCLLTRPGQVDRPLPWIRGLWREPETAEAVFQQAGPLVPPPFPIFRLTTSDSGSIQGTETAVVGPTFCQEARPTDGGHGTIQRGEPRWISVPSCFISTIAISSPAWLPAHSTRR